jgi:hypothetical protein
MSYSKGAWEYPLGHTESRALSDDEPLEVIMQFRLTYGGPLGPSANRSKKTDQKHSIRLELHRQLKQLWYAHPLLKGNTKPVPDITGKSHIERVGKNFERGGCLIVPLVTDEQSLVCSLDILFLRRGDPGDLLRQDGDLDGRIKTLFDALRLPKDLNEMPGEQLSPEEQPLFVLLEDDSLITGFQVTTDRLLIPPESDENKNDVMLVINVTVMRSHGDW